ncbi:MAG: peptide chain release factor N(5)-glutamine methyltransferase [Calothrix sp. SM1_7_51]|nr:peptide chain release factor N(5)-glutamine methyltransferase [Calothrix sp. SM1_7_51]
MEVDWLLQEVAGLERLELRLETFKDRSEIKLSRTIEELDILWQRRLHERLPVQYIAGATSWRHFRLLVSPDVLIPRPETECLIDLALQAVSVKPELASGHWVDLGTGSGAIALGLADAFPQATIHAVDYSANALAIAKKNADNCGLANRIHFYQGSWWEPLEFLKGKLSGMVSNPPYIPSSMVLTLQPEVVNHEPHLALDGGESGLDSINFLIESAPDYLIPGGVWLIEMMAGQAKLVGETLASKSHYYSINIYADLAGIERFAFARVGRLR